MSKGKLYMLPITMGEYNMEMTIPVGVQKIMDEVQVFIVENVKTTRRYLRKINPTYPIDDKEFFVIDKRTSQKELSEFVSNNRNLIIGVMSEAGCPGIADPGAEVVALAHKMQIEVFPFVGPSSILLALIASGKNGQNFTFNGYLPKERGERVKTLKNLERLSRSGITQIFMETPFRNNHLIEDILIHCDNSMELCIASNITLSNQKIKTSTINDWKKSKPEYHKDFCIFVM
jgi:16S rRNA (cytidine1402-2'-O)-methyltransferase|tara:strand:- start:115 stop:810 length:696 start_codon:yes stop_codon:yes gene_type:complete